MVSTSVTDDDLNYTKRDIIQGSCPNALASKAQGIEGKQFYEIEIYHTSGLLIIVQSFTSSNFLRVGNFRWRNPGHSVIRENMLLYLERLALRAGKNE